MVLRTFHGSVLRRRIYFTVNEVNIFMKDYLLLKIGIALKDGIAIYVTDRKRCLLW